MEKRLQHFIFRMELNLLIGRSKAWQQERLIGCIGVPPNSPHWPISWSKGNQIERREQYLSAIPQEGIFSLPSFLQKVCCMWDMWLLSAPMI